MKFFAYTELLENFTQVKYKYCIQDWKSILSTLLRNLFYIWSLCEASDGAEKAVASLISVNKCR